MLVFSIFLFSSLFLISQNAYAFTEWDWIGGGATDNWSDTANWECFTSGDGDPIVCPAPGYPDTLLEDPLGFDHDLVLIELATVTMDVPVVLEPLSKISIETSTITSNSVLTAQRDGSDRATLFVAESTFTNSGTIDNSGDITIFDTHFTNNGQIINSAISEFTIGGPGTNTLINSATGIIINDDVLNIAALETVQNSGTITNNVGAQLTNIGEIINECAGQFVGTTQNGNAPKDNCAFSDADNIPDAIEDILTGSSTGLTVTPGNSLSSVDYSFDTNSNIIFEGKNGGGNTIATFELPPGSTSTGTISVTYSSGFFGATSTISDVNVLSPPGKIMSQKAASPTANQVCIRDLPSGVTQQPPFFGNCFENIVISRVGMNCPLSPAIETRIISGFPDAPTTRTYTCQAIDIGPDRFLEVTGLAFSEIIEFTDEDNDDIHDNCIGGVPDSDGDGIADACEEPIPSTTIQPSKDAFLRSGASNTNEGDNLNLIVRPAGKNRALIEFDASQVSGDIASAKLRLFAVHNGDNWGQTGRDIGAYFATDSFSEGDGANMKPGNLNNADFTPYKNRGNGPGVTWKCSTDSEINNRKADCDIKWNGGTFAETPTDTVTIFKNFNPSNPNKTPTVMTIDEWIEFDVTSDLNTCAGNDCTWMIKNVLYGKPGRVEFASQEGSTNIYENQFGFSVSPELFIEFSN